MKVESGWQEGERPLCVACNVRLKSMGSGQGLRCPSCKERVKISGWKSRPNPRTWDGAPVDARRHLARPLAWEELADDMFLQTMKRNGVHHHGARDDQEHRLHHGPEFAADGRFISQRAMKNRTSMLESSGPKSRGKMRWTAALEILNNLTSRTKMPLRKWPPVKMTTQTTKPESSTVSVVSPYKGTQGVDVPRHRRQISHPFFTPRPSVQ